jgi:uncharacterized protein YcfL
VKSSDVSAKSLSRPALSASQMWKKHVLIMETLWKNNLNLVKEVLTTASTYVNKSNLISSEKKTGGITFVLTFACFWYDILGDRHQQGI